MKIQPVTLIVTERGTPRLVHLILRRPFLSFQIVAFLNDLYLALDNILGNYDVFKVSSVHSFSIMRSCVPLNAQVGWLNDRERFVSDPFKTFQLFLPALVVFSSCLSIPETHARNV